MTKVRAEVVCEQSLYQVAMKHNFSDFLYTGKSEFASHGNKKPAILADSVEAVIAAIYFDGGLQEAEKFIVQNLKEAIEKSTKNVGMKDYKTVLQEKLQENGDVEIKYTIVDTKGPDHDKTFFVKVECNGKFLANGEGKTKKSAEMNAAEKALEQFKQVGGVNMKKEYIIPIFVPHLGCPNNCIFCNQKKISGQTKMVTAKDVKETIEYYLKNFKDNYKYVEVAFFGGSFTAIETKIQEELLQAVQPYIQNKKVHICSTLCSPP